MPSLSTFIAAALLGAPLVSASVQYAGVNIAGCDFGCGTDGSCSGSSCPTSSGPSQMQHFSSGDGLNIFRLPVGWQYLVNNNLGGTLDSNFMSKYDALLNSCLNTGAKCIIDVHNYARWNGKIIGQSGGAVTNDHFVSLWTQLAQRYASKGSQVVFGLMNEPHSSSGASDFDMNTWATTLQAVVNAVRNAVGNNNNWILLSGTNYDALGGFETNSLPALSTVKNKDGSTTNLIYEVHQYYDSDSSGTHAECTANHVDAMTNLYNKLTGTGRQVLMTETGGGNVGSCYNYVCAALDWSNYHSDVYLGWVGWAAGSFSTTYVLSETPNSDGSDQGLVTSCIKGKFSGAKKAKRAFNA